MDKIRTAQDDDDESGELNELNGGETRNINEKDRINIRRKSPTFFKADSKALDYQDESDSFMRHLTVEDASNHGGGNANDHNNHHGTKFDSTGMFHWVEEQNFNDFILDKNIKQPFFGHVIVCVFAEPNSPLIGLRNFVLPLRASNYHYEELKQIIFIGNQTFLAKEWKSICNFPKVFVLPGSPNSRSLLRSVNIQFCDMCVIISSIDRESTDEHLIDKSAILCSLNIKAMNFDDSIGLLGDTHHILPPGMVPLGNFQKVDMKCKSLFGTHVPMLTELSKRFECCHSWV